MMRPREAVAVIVGALGGAWVAFGSPAPDPALALSVATAAPLVIAVQRRRERTRTIGFVEETDRRPIHRGPCDCDISDPRWLSSDGEHHCASWLKRKCAHEDVVEVESLGGETVAWWCPSCETQTDTDPRPPARPASPPEPTGAVTTWYQEEPPTSGMEEGDIWMQVEAIPGGDVIEHRWSDGTWKRLVYSVDHDVIRTWGGETVRVIETERSEIVDPGRAEARDVFGLKPKWTAEDEAVAAAKEAQAAAETKALWEIADAEREGRGIFARPNLSIFDPLSWPDGDLGSRDG